MKWFVVGVATAQVLFIFVLTAVVGIRSLFRGEPSGYGLQGTILQSLGVLILIALYWLVNQK